MSATSWAIEVEGLTKRFGQGDSALQALDGLSFQVPKDGVFCILGPNGAGKTTLIRILTTLMRPLSGSARIEGLDVQKDALAVRQKIGVVFQENHFDKYLTIWDNLKLHAQLHDMSQKNYAPILDKLLRKVNLWDRRHQTVDKLSGGMQRRVALIRALIHSPRVLFLDEPSTGLDPQARREIWDTIQEFKRNATVVLTTHYMEEADYLSDHILMMNHGQKVLAGTAQELKRRIGPQNQYEVEFFQPDAAQYVSALEAQGLQNIVVATPHSLVFSLEAPERLFQVLEAIPTQEVVRVGRVEAELESVFLEVARGGLRSPNTEAPS